MDENKVESGAGAALTAHSKDASAPGRPSVERNGKMIMRLRAPFSKQRVDLPARWDHQFRTWPEPGTKTCPA